jgi:hypothetical protein
MECLAVVSFKKIKFGRYHGKNQSKCLHLVKPLTMGLWELGLHSIPPHVRPEFRKSRS